MPIEEFPIIGPIEASSYHSTQLQLLLAEQKTVIVAAAINIVAHDLDSRVDPTRFRQNGARYIDGRKYTVA
jgi:hypothetical protein